MYSPCFASHLDTVLLSFTENPMKPDLRCVNPKRVTLNPNPKPTLNPKFPPAAFAGIHPLH